MIKNLKRVGGALARRGRSAPAAPVERRRRRAVPWLLAFGRDVAGLVVVVAAGLLFKRAKKEREVK